MEKPLNRAQIKSILTEARTIAVVGLSDNPDRTSHMIAQAMQQEGYRIIPVNPNIERVLGEKAYASLLDIPEKVDIVNVFRRSEFTVPIAKEAVKIKASTLWLQQGIVNDEAASIASAGGLYVVMNRCIKVEQALMKAK